MSFGHKIIMVDDMERYHTLYERAITESIQAHVTFAKDGLLGLEILDQMGPFDLMILDLAMPRMQGEEVLRKVRQDKRYDQMPVVILTGNTDGTKQHELLNLGADDFIEKGSPPEVFVARVRSQLRYRSTLENLAQLSTDTELFAAGVLHDVRNLETSIISLCMLMDEYLSTEEDSTQEMISDVNLLIKRSEKIGRYAYEVMEVVKKTYQVFTLTPQKVIDSFLWAIEMIHQVKDLEWQCDESLVDVMADKHFMRLTMLNLVTNSVKYRTPHMPIRIEISQKPSKRKVNSTGIHSFSSKHIEAENTVVTCVRDYGIGIPKSELGRVFRPFVRGYSAKKDGGFGLGLSLVTKVIHRMGGTIWAEEPEHGPGVIICFELPVAKNF